MKKLIAYCMTAFVMAACSDQTLRENEAELNLTNHRMCSTMGVLKANLATDPGLQARMDAVEAHSLTAIRNGDVARINAQGKIEIPVVVNVLYRIASENISDAQIQSQIDVLNEDFNKTNADASQIPTLFSGVAADVDIQFVLHAVIRKSSNKRSWQTNDDMKKSSRGGIDPTDPSLYMNVWVVNSMGGVLGYAQFPGGSPATDGIVVAHRYFGRTGVLSPPFDKGRTATHEVGHYLNLRHIWGDTACGNDFVADTPVHNTYNFGCPTYPHLSTCSGTPTEMTMNYMDYTDDACMYMFSEGQKSRMLAIFAPGGARASMAQ